MPAPDPQQGRVIAERFRLVSELGRGGMASVWRAEHLALKAPVAIKLLDPSIGEDPEMAERFLREAQAAAALRSRHVVQIFDYGVDDGVPFIAMELLDGESLRERLERLDRLAASELVRIFAQVARAAMKAHDAGIVHRDLKPDNIFLVRDEDETAKVLDFGIAKFEKGVGGEGESLSTLTGKVLGTPFYMSPEQARGDRAIDHRTDLWALAVIAFECLTGVRPFEGHGLGDIIVNICTAPVPVPSAYAPVPDGFDQWFSRAVDRDPTARFQSAREMSDALSALLGPGATSMAVSPPVLSPEFMTVPTLVSETPSAPLLETLTERTATVDVPVERFQRRSPRWKFAAFGAGIGLVALLVMRGVRSDESARAHVTAHEEPEPTRVNSAQALPATPEPVLAPAENTGEPGAPATAEDAPAGSAEPEQASRGAAPSSRVAPTLPSSSARIAEAPPMAKSRRAAQRKNAEIHQAPAAAPTPSASPRPAQRTGWEVFSDRE